MRFRVFAIALSLPVLWASWTVPASAAVTPGWECIPITAGQAVVSGGTGSNPSCGAGTTAVLAPTFVASGVGGKPTAEFSSVNVQVVDGSGLETAVNGTGNLVLGYDEKPGQQNGSHNLVLGGSNTYTSYGGIVAGLSNSIVAAYASVLGGSSNSAAGANSAVVGGFANKAASNSATVVGGCSNIAGSGTISVNENCRRTTEHPSGYASVLGGAGNQATATAATIAGGDYNLASGPYSSVVAGCENVAGNASPLLGSCVLGAEAVLGGFENFATTFEATVSGGESNVSRNTASSILGGVDNSTSANCQAIPAASGSC